MGIVMILSAAIIGRVRIVPQYSPGYLQSPGIAFIVFPVLCVAERLCLAGKRKSVVMKSSSIARLSAPKAAAVSIACENTTLLNNRED
jgi:hypothetical protein